MRHWIKRNPNAKRVALWAMRCMEPIAGVARLSAIPGYWRVLGDWRRFRAAGGTAAVLDFYPCLFDRTATTGIDAHYFHQALWAFRKIFESRATHHIDVGSEVNFVGLLSVVTSVTFVDIRPLKLEIANFEGISGSILELPFAAGTVRSFSSLHVLEHIGLGRYGDPIDPTGPKKAASEIQRVLATDGRAYISVPIGRPRVQFNGQRVFAVSEIRTMFHALRLTALSIVDARGRFVPNVDPATCDIGEDGAGLDYGLGMFEFRKSAAEAA